MDGDTAICAPLYFVDIDAVFHQLTDNAFRRAFLKIVAPLLVEGVLARSDGDNGQLRQDHGLFNASVHPL